MPTSINLGKFFLYLIIALLSVHFVKEEFFLYIIILGFIYISAFLLMVSENNFSYTRSVSFIFYILFLVSLIWVGIWTFNFFNDDTVQINFNLLDYFNSLGRLFLMPLLPIIILYFANKKEDYETILIYFLIIFCIGSLSMLLQQIIGGIDILGSFGPPRFRGLSPFPSTLGNITVYGSGVAIAIVICMMNEKVNTLIKSILLTILIMGVFLTMQKSALVNLIIGMTILIIFFKSSQIFVSLIYLFLFSLSFIFFMPDLLLNVASLFANTFGFKFEYGGTDVFHVGIYNSIFDRFIDRQIDWLRTPSNIGEILFGYGLPGGTDAMGYTFQTSLWHDSKVNPQLVMGTTHNAYLDLYQMGGFFLPLIFITLALSIIKDLFISWIKTGDNISKILFNCNLVFLINCFVANGVLFHPIVSLPFWLSIAYVLSPIKKVDN